jgi:hypothetical protein
MAGTLAQAAPALATGESSSAPTVSTGQAGGVAQNAATLTGTVNTQGFETVYEFDLGTDTSYGTRIFGDAGAEPGTQTFTFALQGLAPGTTYHYRILATNGFGTVYGADQTFTTGAYSSSILIAPSTPALVPAPLLAVAPRASAAKVASVKPNAQTAHDSEAGARKGGIGRLGRRRRGGSHGRGHAHGANGRGK